jgi:hypothetical protein
VTDHDAMTAINDVLDEWFNIGITAVDALHKIARVSGENRIDHEEVTA